MAITRRIFLRNGAFALVGVSAIPAFLTRTLQAQTAAARAQGKTLVVIFQRGAADGLNIVIPYREQSYYALRPTIGIPAAQVIDLDGEFGLHPEMQSLKPLWEQGHLAVVHAVGSPDPTRSHFDAQDFMESGTPGVKDTPDGWLNRALSAQDAAVRHLRFSPFRAVALGAEAPRTLQGRVEAVAMNNLRDFRIGGPNPAPNPALIPVDDTLSHDYQTMYAESQNAVLHGTASETFEAVRALQSADPAQYAPRPGANYPNGTFGNSMRQIAQLLKANLGVEAAFADIGGWDTHQNQGAANGQLANRLREFSQSMTAFWLDMGDQAENVVLVTMSEFGRTVQQNGTGGTDHGHANVMFVLGGPVQGRRVYGKWPGLDKDQLYQQRDLAITTDFRQVLGEVAYRTLGAENLNTVFPGASLDRAKFLNILKA